MEAETEEKKKVKNEKIKNEKVKNERDEKENAKKEEKEEEEVEKEEKKEGVRRKVCVWGEMKSTYLPPKHHYKKKENREGCRSRFAALSCV